MLRPLRYAPALAFALLALAFVGLWVRSYYFHDSFYRYRSGKYLGVASWQGGLAARSP